VNCLFTPTKAEDVAGVTAIDVSVGGGGLTVIRVEPLTEAWLALIVVVPAATAVANPALLTVATDGFDDAQVAVEVRSFVLLSLYVPVAVNC
jgi:hypothetical protein